jgi:hypothetical protein
MNEVNPGILNLPEFVSYPNLQETTGNPKTVFLNTIHSGHDKALLFYIMSGKIYFRNNFLADAADDCVL